MLTEAHLFYHAERYDIVGKKVFKSKGKYYATDLGARSILVNADELRDVSAPLENIVYFELLRRGYSVFVGSYRDKEIDFTAVKGDDVRYYQVSQTVMGEDTYEREVRPLKAVDDNYRKTVLTLDRFGLGNCSSSRSWVQHRTASIAMPIVSTPHHRRASLFPRKILNGSNPTRYPNSAGVSNPILVRI